MSGIIAAVGCFCLLAYVLSQQSFDSPTAFLTPPSVASVQTVGVSIFSMYSLPFEIAGILLLISLVGASVIASSIKSKKE
jgi:NADH:ubiquinone oxidoreductase subunit 6 (subunit J)